MSAAPAVIGALVIFLSAQFALKTKRQFDGHAGVIALCEEALRNRSIARSDLAMPPFGYAGWHLYPYFITHEGRDQPNIAGFVDYLKPGSLKLETRGASDPRPIENPETIVAQGDFRIMWRERHHFILRRAETAGDAKLPLSDPRAPSDWFPLNDAEWRKYTDGTPRRPK